jgi:hypothetical protein
MSPGQQQQQQQQQEDHRRPDGIDEEARSGPIVVSPYTRELERAVQQLALEEQKKHEEEMFEQANAVTMSLALSQPPSRITSAVNSPSRRRRGTASVVWVQESTDEENDDDDDVDGEDEQIELPARDQNTNSGKYAESNGQNKKRPIPQQNPVAAGRMDDRQEHNRIENRQRSLKGLVFLDTTVDFDDDEDDEDRGEDNGDSARFGEDSQHSLRLIPGSPALPPVAPTTSTATSSCAIASSVTTLPEHSITSGSSHIDVSNPGSTVRQARVLASPPAEVGSIPEIALSLALTLLSNFLRRWRRSHLLYAWKTWFVYPIISQSSHLPFFYFVVFFCFPFFFSGK